MNAKAQAKQPAKAPVAPVAAHIPRTALAVAEQEDERPEIETQLEGAARLGHSLGAVAVDSPSPFIIQRDVYDPDEDDDGFGEEDYDERQPMLQRKEQPEGQVEEMIKSEEGRLGPQGGPVPPDMEAAIRRARGGGQPLEGGLQEQMSASMGHDFGGVRVHTGPEADTLNQQLQAKAFTTGQDVFFREGEYHPGSAGGRELIAHELTHVVQQTSGRGPGGVGRTGTMVWEGGDHFEQVADEMGQRVAMRGLEQRGRGAPLRESDTRNWGTAHEQRNVAISDPCAIQLKPEPYQVRKTTVLYKQPFFHRKREKDKEGAILEGRFGPKKICDLPKGQHITADPEKRDTTHKYVWGQTKVGSRKEGYVRKTHIKPEDKPRGKGRRGPFPAARLTRYPNMSHASLVGPQVAVTQEPVVGRGGAGARSKHTKGNPSVVTGSLPGEKTGQVSFYHLAGTAKGTPFAVPDVIEDWDFGGEAGSSGSVSESGSDEGEGTEDGISSESGEESGRESSQPSEDDSDSDEDE